MPEVTTEIDGCTECSNFSYTVDNGCVCRLEGLEKMIENGIYTDFNESFHNGELFKTIPGWCRAKKD